MALAKAIQNARHTAQRVTWLDGDGDAQDLTGATLTGRIQPEDGSPARAVAGTLTVVDAEAGVFDWLYGAADVADDGRFKVQFVATYGDALNDKTLIEPWVVAREIVLP